MPDPDMIRASLDCTGKGKVKQTIGNCVKVLRLDPKLKGAIKENELTSRRDIVRDLGWGRRPGTGISDVDESNLQLYLEQTYGLTNDRHIDKALRIVASENHYHLIKDYLEGLKWDRRERIRHVLPLYLGADENDYTQEVMELLLKASIRRIYEPGCKFEIMVCLVGGQGTGKSTFFRFLACKDEWFSDDLRRIDDEQVYRKMAGHWIIEMSEMIATVNAKSIEEIKSFISRQMETYKIPYDRYPQDRPRQCVFVGTSNNMDFLPLDRSGNRRFAPVMVHPGRVKKHILADEREAREYISQVWAEAMVLYQQDKKHELKLSDKNEAYLKTLQKDFMPEDTKVGIIQEWLDTIHEDYVCSMMVYREALGNDRGDPKLWETKEICNILNSSITGWESGGHHRFKKYGMQRCWKRKADDNGLYLMPEDVKIPFEENTKKNKSFLALFTKESVAVNRCLHRIADKFGVCQQCKQCKRNFCKRQ